MNQEAEMLLKDRILQALKPEDIVEQKEEDGVFAIHYTFRNGEMHGYACIIADTTIEENGTNKVFGKHTFPADEAISLDEYIQSTKDSGCYALAKEA